MEEIQLLLEMVPKTEGVGVGDVGVWGCGEVCVWGKNVMKKHPDLTFHLPSNFSPVLPIDPTLLETT